MNDFSKRLLKRSIAVAVVLGLMGYIFAEVFLVLSRMNGGVVNPANDSVRWRTPLTMAAIGVVLQVIVELAAFALRSKKPATRADPTVSSNSTGPSGSSTA